MSSHKSSVRIVNPKASSIRTRPVPVIPETPPGAAWPRPRVGARIKSIKGVRVINPAASKKF